MDGPKRTTASVTLQDRDKRVLRGLFESRIMTTEHAMELYFDGNYETAKKRLGKLKTAGILTERPRRPTDPSVLFLTRKGIQILQNEGVLADYPAFNLPALENRARVSDLTIRHELEVMDVKTAFYSARKQHAVEIEEFTTWPLLHEFVTYHPRANGKEILVKPDAFIQLSQSESGGGRYRYWVFLEVDRSEEVQEKLVAKAEAYREYYRTGGFAVRNGGNREAVDEFPFRVLIVLQNDERRNNTAERLLQIDQAILRMVWLSTLSEVTNDPFGPVWVRPVDYRDMCKGTRFEPERTVKSSVYRRNRERERFIESKIPKRRLFDSDLP